MQGVTENLVVEFQLIATFLEILALEQTNMLKFTILVNQCKLLPPHPRHSHLGY
jgi:hypothetical protein